MIGVKGMENKSGYLFVDDIIDTDTNTIPKELFEQYPMPQRGKVLSGTFGTFNINDFENAVRRD